MEPRSPTLQGTEGPEGVHHLSHQGSPRILAGVPIPSPGGLPDPGIELESPALQADSLPAERPGKPLSFLLVPQVSHFHLFCIEGFIQPFFQGGSAGAEVV